MREAETHADEDRRKKGLVEARNEADALVYTTEKSLQELKDRLDESSRTQVSNAVQALKSAMRGDDVAEIRRLSEDLKRIAQQMGSTAYSQGPAGAGTGGTASADPSQKSHEDVVDAEFEEVH